MSNANKPVEYFTYEDEGHSFLSPRTSFFYARAEEFLARYLGRRFEPAAGLRAQRRKIIALGPKRSAIDRLVRVFIDSVGEK